MPGLCLIAVDSCASQAMRQVRRDTNEDGGRLLWPQGLPQELMALRQRPVDDADGVEVQDVEHHEHDLQVTKLRRRKASRLR